MKTKIAILITIGLMVMLSASIVSADPCIVLDEYETTPGVLMPGDKGILKVTIKNMNGAGATTTMVNTDSSSDSETDNDYDGSVVDQTETETNQQSSQTTSVSLKGVTIEEIWVENASDGNGNNVTVNLHHDNLSYLTPSAFFDVEFEVSAEENITEGNYFPKVHIDLKNSNYDDVTFPVLIKIQNSTVDFHEKDVSSRIPAGGSSEVSFTVVNHGDQMIKSVTVKPLDYSDVEFSPKSFHVGSLEGGSSNDVSFSIKTDSYGVKNSSFLITYKNGDNFHNETFNPVFKVVDNSEVQPVLYSVPSTISKGDNSRFRLEVFNAKSEKISGVVVTPVSDEDVVFSPSKYFIGSMDPDDVFSAVFDVSTVNLGLNKNYTVGFKVSYKQEDYYYESPMVESSFKVVEPEKKESSLGLFTNIGIVVIVVIVILVVLVSFLKRKRRIG